MNMMQNSGVPIDAGEMKYQPNRIAELEAENQKLREQRDAANAQIQMLNRIIAGDAE